MNRPLLFTFIVALSGAFLPAIATSQSLWRDEISKPVFADKRATRVGNTVAIVVQENTAASKDNDPQTGTESPMDASISSFFYRSTTGGMLTKGGQLTGRHAARRDGHL